MRITFAKLFLVITGLLSGCGHKTPPEIELRYEKNESLEYHEVIEAYDKLSEHYRQAHLFEMGLTDAGKPLHLFMISGDGDFNPSSIKQKGRSIVLINNGIHAGEPAGIDASIEYAINILGNIDGMARVLENSVVAIIPVYNVGGSLNRSPYYRMNQNGPELKGARRNARNLDLNRDFMKMDSENARSFAEIFHYLEPDVFLDTHTTNGSDHQSVMTLISTMHQKLPPGMGEFFKRTMVPELYRRMTDETPYGMVPYVQPVDRGNIRKGLAGFNDHPYYSTGYASLFNTFAFMTENLVYKPFPERVKSTYEFIRILVEFTADNCREIIKLRAMAVDYTAGRSEYVLNWTPDLERYDKIIFNGYETRQSVSPLTKREMMVYDHERPWSDTIRFYDYFRPYIRVEAPEAYIIPGAWREVIDRLALNGVKISFFEQDTIIMVENLYVDDFISSPQSNQGRHQITDIKKRREVGERQFHRGDVVVRLDQGSNNYIVQALEPLSAASFLRWGFFTSALEDGEFFRIYSFEDHASEIL